MAARRIVGGIIVALLSLIAMALFIVTLYIPHINGRIQQISSSVILEPYGADLEFYLTRGTATNDYGEEIWAEDPYGSDIGSALVFGRCPDALDDLRLVRRLVVACTILCGASAGLAIISIFFCGRLARCGAIPMLLSLLTSLAAVGLMVWVAVLFFTVYDDHRDCLSSFGADENFQFPEFTVANSVRQPRGRKLRPADIDTFIYTDDNRTGTGQFYSLRSTGNVEYFESILTPQYQQVYTNLTSDEQFQFRRGVAIGAVGEIRVSDVRLAQGIRVLIAAWAVALISAILAIIFSCIFCCCPRSSDSAVKRHGKHKNREVVTHTTITTTDFPPQLYANSAANPNSSIDHDFHNPNATAPNHQFQAASAQAANVRSPVYVDVRDANAFVASTAEPIDQPYTYNAQTGNQQVKTTMPEERVLRGNTITNKNTNNGTSTTYSSNKHAMQHNHHSHRPLPLHVGGQSKNPTPIGYLSISSPTSHPGDMA